MNLNRFWISSDLPILLFLWNNFCFEANSSCKWLQGGKGREQSIITYQRFRIFPLPESTWKISKGKSDRGRRETKAQLAISTSDWIEHKEILLSSRKILRGECVFLYRVLNRNFLCPRPCVSFWGCKPVLPLKNWWSRAGFLYYCNDTLSRLIHCWLVGTALPCIV